MGPPGSERSRSLFVLSVVRQTAWLMVCGVRVGKEHIEELDVFEPYGNPSMTGQDTMRKKIVISASSSILQPEPEGSILPVGQSVHGGSRLEWDASIRTRRAMRSSLPRVAVNVGVVLLRLRVAMARSWRRSVASSDRACLWPFCREDRRTSWQRNLVSPKTSGRPAVSCLKPRWR